MFLNILFFPATLKVKVEKVIITPFQIFNSLTFVISLGTHAIECQNINDKNRIYFLKIIFWPKCFSIRTNCRSGHFRVFFCESYSENFINFTGEHSKCWVTHNFRENVFLGNLQNFSNSYSQKQT